MATAPLSLSQKPTPRLNVTRAAPVQIGALKNSVQLSLSGAEGRWKTPAPS
jgi:hypothetical protein